MTADNTLVDELYKQSPQASTEYYDKPEGPQLCGCMGPRYGEPYCSCRMANLGLPLSKAHVLGLAENRKAWQKLLDSGWFNKVETP